MTRALLHALASPRFLLGLVLLGAVVLLCLAACGPGADRTPKMNATIHAPFNSRIGSPFASNYKTGVKVGFTDDGLLLITATQKGPIKEFSFDGGKWCDVYADARGLHWKDCKTGESSDDTPQLFSKAMDLVEEVRELRARLKMLENPPPAYRADPSWNVYVGPIEDVPHYAPCGEGQSSNIVDAKTGKPLCRVDASKGGKP